MKTRLAFALILAINLIHGIHSSVFNIKNNCPHRITPAIWALSEATMPTGFELASSASNNIDIPTPWLGQVWARYECSNDGESFHCDNEADETSPVSIAFFSIGHTPDGKDYYGLSLLNGFNLPVSVVPQGDCETVDCHADINDKCPPELAVKGGSGKTIGCKSACLAFGKPEYCCDGDYGTPEKCLPTDYSKYFKDLCPKAHTYAYDNSTRPYTCNTGANYVITFCP